MKLKEKIKIQSEAVKAMWKGFYSDETGDRPERAYRAGKKTARLIYDMKLKEPVERLKKFFKERR